jgi:hypothetical protein
MENDSKDLLEFAIHLLVYGEDEPWGMGENMDDETLRILLDDRISTGG